MFLKKYLWKQEQEEEKTINMKKIIRLTESDLTRIVKKAINESKSLTKKQLDQMVKDSLITPRDSEILKLYYIDNMSFDDIANKFDRTVSSTKQLIKKLYNDISDVDGLKNKRQSKDDSQKENHINKVKKEMKRVKFYLDNGYLTKNEIMSLFKDVLNGEEKLTTLR
jgi:predicted DNA-binding protein YlxM (UPF0122 family)